MDTEPGRREPNVGVAVRPHLRNGRPEEIAALAAVPLFHGLTATQLTALAPTLRTKRLAAREALVEAEEPGDAAYVIRDGFVRVQITQADGAEIILAILGPGDIVGEMSLVDHLGRSATAIAHEAATLLVVDRAAFEALLRRLPAVGYNLSRILSRRLRLANAHIQALATLDVDGRVAHELLAYAAEYGVPAGDGAVRLPFHLTQSDLAALVGASRVRVNQILGEYKRRGYLAADDHHHLTIFDPAALAGHDSGAADPWPGVLSP